MITNHSPACSPGRRTESFLAVTKRKLGRSFLIYKCFCLILSISFCRAARIRRLNCARVAQHPEGWIRFVTRRNSYLLFFPAELRRSRLTATCRRRKSFRRPPEFPGICHRKTRVPMEVCRPQPRPTDFPPSRVAKATTTRMIRSSPKTWTSTICCRT